MYIQGFVLPVPAEMMEAYRDIAERFWEIARDYGAVEHVEAWEDDVKDGEYTDFRRAVDLKPGEKVVFSWVIFTDKAACEAGQAAMMADPRMEQFSGEMPFDGKRMIFGGFTPLVVRGRG